MSTTNSFWVYAEWVFSATYGYLLLLTCLEFVMSWIKPLSVISLETFCFTSSSGYYLEVILCCWFMGCDVVLLASFSAGTLAFGDSDVKWLTSFVGLCDAKIHQFINE
jgi:hypothetical protein